MPGDFQGATSCSSSSSSGKFLLYVIRKQNVLWFFCLVTGSIKRYWMGFFGGICAQIGGVPDDPPQHLLLLKKPVIIPLASSWKVTGFSFFAWWSWSSSGRKFSCSPTAASSVLLLWLSSFLGLGKDLGRNQKGIPDSMITVPVMMKPSHQAPTQRESLWLMVMVSGREQTREKQEIMRVGFLAGDPWPLPFQQLRYLQEGRGTGTC